MFKRVQTKIIVLVSFVSLIILLGIFIYWLNETAKQNLLLAERIKDNQVLLDKVIEIKGDNLKSFVYDYSYWDEMVSFVNSDDKNWARVNIIEPMTHFNIQAAWVFNNDMSYVYSYNNIGLIDFKYPIEKKDLVQLSKDQFFFHFFIKTDKGLMEIRGAPIQPSGDIERKTSPHGFFIVGRLWTKEYTGEIESIASQKLYIIDLTEPDDKIIKKNSEDYFIVTSKIVFNWKNEPVAKLVSLDESKYVKEALATVKNQLVNHSIFALILISTLIYFLMKLINTPIRTISRSLTSNTPALIEPLLKEENEFGNLANLIKEFFEQKKRLIAEITERKLIEKELRENEERLELVLEGSNEGFWDLDLKTGKVEINEKWFYNLGYFKNEIPLLIKNWNKIVHPDELDKIVKVFFKHLRSETPMFETEHRLMKKSGDWIWVSNRGRIVSQDKDSRPIRFAGTITDITSRRNAEEIIRQNEKKYGFIISNVQDIIFQTDENCSILFINPAWYELTGYSAEESIGKNLVDFIFEPDRGQNYEFIKSVLEGRTSDCKYETRYLNKNSVSNWVEVFICPVKENNMIKGITGTLHDISKRKVAEEEILNVIRKERELNELRTRFVSMVSHEYRTPLASILSSSELLKLFINELTEEEKDKHISNIIKNVDDMNEMLNDVLYINKAEAGKITFQPESFEIISFCKELIDEVRPVKRTNIEILFMSNRVSKEVFADKKLIKYILNNFLTNALKYSYENCPVNFELLLEERWITFKIRNNGIGIPAQDKNRVFDPFFRARNVSSIGGTGLGLSIAKICAELHNCEIWFESDTGKETIFFLKLPV